MLRRILIAVFLFSQFVMAQTSEDLDLLRRLESRVDSGYRDVHTLRMFFDCTLFLAGSDPEKSIEFATYFIDVATELRETDLLARVYNFRANTYRLLGIPDLALRDYLKGVEISKAYDYRSSELYFMMDIGNVYYDLKEYKQAEAYYHNIVRAAASEGLYEVQAAAVNNLGLVDLKFEKFKEALGHFKKGFQLRSEQGTDFQVSHSAEYVGRTFSLLGMRDSADYYYQLSLELAYKDERYFGRQRVYEKRAEHYMSVGELEKAKNDLDSSMYYAQILDDKQLISALHLVISDYYVLKGENKRALTELNEAVKVAIDPQFNREIYDAYFKSYEIYRSIGEPEKALENFVYADSLEQIIRNKSAAMRISQTQYEQLVNEREQELLESRQKADLREAQLRAEMLRNERLFFIIGGFLFVLIILSISFFKINNARKRLSEFNEVVEKQKNQIEQKNRELEVAISKAENNLEVKSQFLNKMSHEIRTPMNAILGLTEYLLINSGRSDANYQNLRTIHSSATVLLELINEILDYSRIESGKVELSREEFSIRETVEDHYRLIRGRAEEKGNRIVLSIDNQIDFKIIADRVKYIQVLTNLTSNANKFCDNGEIHITTDYFKEGDLHWIRTTVSDTGMGIAREKQEMIFEQFTQASSNIHRQYGGTGLGLSISKGLVGIMGGSISVESELGKGASFSFEIPVEITEKQSDSGSVDEVYSKPVLHGKVLVVEDDAINRKLISQILKNWETEFEIAENGAVALEKFDASYDILLVDIQMPVMDGLEFSRRVRAGAVRADVPIIALTADVLSEAFRNAMDAGINEVLTKPFRQKELLHTMRKYLHNNYG